MLRDHEEERALLLAAELGAALPARRSAVDFACHFLGDKDPGLKKDLAALRTAEARLEASASSPLDNAPVLARLAVQEAEAIEAEIGRLEAWLRPEAQGRDLGTVRLVAGLLWEARYGEGRAKACLSARRKRQFLPSFDEALDLAPENELLYLALRRFSRLLHAGGPWIKADLDWLRLRAATLPGRLKLHAADLRSAAEAAGPIPLPEALIEARRPFVQFGYEPGPALAWAMAGFTLSEALVWGAAGLPWAPQALAWHAWGLNAQEAAAWAAADLLPDEAAAFKACGATDPATARELRQVLGDVEHLLAWHRAGIDPAEVLRLRAEGVKDPEAAVRARRMPAKAPLGKATPVDTAAAPALKPVAEPAPAAKPKRATAAPADWGKEGGAWLGWGVYEAGSGELGKPRSLTRSRAIEGGFVDVVSASEGVALEGVPYSCPSLEQDPEWQSQLDWHRQEHGRESQSGQWMLAALAPKQARLYWGLHFKTPAAPWGTAIDFDASETWIQRWKRRVEEWGEKGQACPCAVERTPAGGWQVAAPASLVNHAGPAPLRLEVLEPLADWVEAVEHFCLVMGIGQHAAAWQLLALEKT